jgi:hypothetical protein
LLPLMKKSKRRHHKQMKHKTTNLVAVMVAMEVKEMEAVMLHLSLGGAASLATGAVLRAARSLKRKISAPTPATTASSSVACSPTSSAGARSATTTPKPLLQGRRGCVTAVVLGKAPPPGLSSVT